MLASATCGVFAKRSVIHCSVGSTGTRVHPRDETEREEVLRAVGVARLHAERRDRALRQRRHRHLVDRVALEAAVTERVLAVAGLREVALLEGVAVDDQRSARLEQVQLALERGRVHGDEDLRGVARRGDLVVGDVDLKCRNAGEGACRRSDLSGKLRERGEVIAQHGAHRSEAIAGELHAIARVAREADDHTVEVDDLARALGCIGHRCPVPPGPEPIVTPTATLPLPDAAPDDRERKGCKVPFPQT